MNESPQEFLRRALRERTERMAACACRPPAAAFQAVSTNGIIRLPDGRRLAFSATLTPAED